MINPEQYRCEPYVFTLWQLRKTVEACELNPLLHQYTRHLGTHLHFEEKRFRKHVQYAEDRKRERERLKRKAEKQAKRRIEKLAQWAYEHPTP